MMLIAYLLSAMGGAVLGVATMCLITVAKEADDQLTNAASRAKEIQRREDDDE